MKCQTVIAGIGGQGVLFAAKILTEIARRREVPVLGSQTFGMAQRGGSVTTHLKMGEFESPLICEGDADLLLALDAVEAPSPTRAWPAWSRTWASSCIAAMPTAKRWR